MNSPDRSRRTERPIEEAFHSIGRRERKPTESFGSDDRDADEESEAALAKLVQVSFIEAINLEEANY